MQKGCHETVQEGPRRPGGPCGAGQGTCGPGVPCRAGWGTPQTWRDPSELDRGPRRARGTLRTGGTNVATGLLFSKGSGTWALLVGTPQACLGHGILGTGSPDTQGRPPEPGREAAAAPTPVWPQGDHLVRMIPAWTPPPTHGTARSMQTGCLCLRAPLLPATLRGLCQKLPSTVTKVKNRCSRPEACHLWEMMGR